MFLMKIKSPRFLEIYNSSDPDSNRNRTGIIFVNHKCHKWSLMSQIVTNSNLTGTNLLRFMFRLKWFGMNEIRQNIPEIELFFSWLSATSLRKAA